MKGREGKEIMGHRFRKKKESGEERVRMPVEGVSREGKWDEREECTLRSVD